ncbi:unnamed protein product, partial [Ixodes hexagonus]
MGLRYALLYTCIATACCGRMRWETEMTVKNHENNPFLNDVELGPFQNAWKVCLSGEHMLVEHTLHHVSTSTRPGPAAEAGCGFIKPDIQLVIDFFYFSTNVTMKVRALNQSDYPLENVIRGSFNGTTPSDTPIPLGSNNYIVYDNYTCLASDRPLWGDGKFNWYSSGDYLPRTDPRAELFGVHRPVDLDFYVVYNQPTCNVLRI